MAKQLIMDAIESLRSLSPPSSPKNSAANRSSKRFSLRKSVQSRSSKLLTFGTTKSAKDFPTQLFADEMARLETVLISQKGRQLLIQKLLTLPGNHSVKVRFISAVDTFDAAENKEDRQRLGQKIVETFIQTGSMFTIELSGERTDAIFAGNFDQLFQARRDILEDLASKAEVMTIVEEVESTDGV